MYEWRYEPARDLDLALPERLRSVRREPGLVESMGHLAWWTMMRGYLRTFHRLHIDGRERLPSAGPFVLVANHASHLDALVLATSLSWRLRDDVFPIAAGDTFFETPVTAALSAVFINALPMWRKRAGGHAMTDLRRRLIDECCAYIVFPEGTRSRTGRIAPFKAGIGMLVAGTSVPVVPCHLAGTFAALSSEHRFPRPARVRLRIGMAREYASQRDEREGWDFVARDLEGAVRELPSHV